MITIIFIVVFSAAAGLLWARYNHQQVALITVTSSTGLAELDEHSIAGQEAMSVPEIGKIIADGAAQFI